MIIINPEFHRNLWLRFSPWRLVAMPLLVFLTLGMFVKFTDDWASTASTLSISMIYVVLFLWGNYEAAKAPVAEVREKSWDFQKMSSLGPWELTLGKLFGATSYVWYFALTLLAVFCIAQTGHALSGQVLSFDDYRPPSPTSEFASFSEVVFAAVMMVGCGLMGHAAAFFVGLYHMKAHRFGVVGSFIVGFIVSHTALSMAEMADFSVKFGHIAKTTEWLGMHIPNNNFVLMSMAFFLFWLLIGNQRLMREEIGFRNKPVAWGLFLATMAAYLAGVFGGAPFNAMGGYIAAFIFVLCAGYGTMVGEASDLTRYRKFRHGLTNAQPRMWQENLPKWAVAAAIALVLIPLVALNAKNPENSGNILIFLIGVSLLCVRDGMVIHAIMLQPGGRYGPFTLLVYWAMVYFLLPGLFVGENIGEFFEEALTDSAKAGDFRVAMSFFFPVATAKAPGYLMPIIAEIALGFFILKSRLENIQAKALSANRASLPSSEKSL